MILSLQIRASKVAAHWEQLSQVLGTGSAARDAPAQRLGREGGIRAAQFPAAGSSEQFTHGNLASHEQSRAIQGTLRSVCYSVKVIQHLEGSTTCNFF